MTKEEHFKNLIELFPDFKALWESNNNYFKEDNGSYTIHGLFSEFSHLVSERLESGNTEKMKELFDYIEEIASNGNEDEQNAVCTCFLENILNRIPQKIDPKYFVPFLGKCSKDYCIAWDKFTGIKTKGL